MASNSEPSIALVTNKITCHHNPSDYTSVLFFEENRYVVLITIILTQPCSIRPKHYWPNVSGLLHGCLRGEYLREDVIILIYQCLTYSSRRNLTQFDLPHIVSKLIYLANYVLIQDVSKMYGQIGR